MNEIFYLKDYPEYYNYAKTKGLTIIEIEADEMGRRFKLIDENPKNILINELETLKTWFNDYYTTHEQKYRRLNTLGNKEAYNDLLKLYNEAEIKRARIQELEAKIGF